jgi:RND family efflux transporter MFP subunit
MGCQPQPEPHSHAEEHPAGHDHHEEGHGHAEPMVRITAWNAAYELFAEHPSAVSGVALEILVHLTELKAFRPVMDARLELTLTGPATLEAVTSTMTRPGIYRMQLTPSAPGTFRGSLKVNGDAASQITGFAVVVASEPDTAAEGHLEHHESGEIELLKEQQWGVSFQTAPVELGTVSPIADVPGIVDLPPGATATVSAPVTGRLVPLPTGLPRPGQQVGKDQVLALLSPAPGSPEEAARVDLVLAEAAARASAARAALERAERLVLEEALPARAVEEARREVKVAAEAVRSARRAAEALAAAKGETTGREAWELRAPIAGVIDTLDAQPGATLLAGERLATVLDLRELWIRARVPAHEVGSLGWDRELAYRPTGDPDWRHLALSGPNPGARLVDLARTVHPTARTVEVVFSLAAPDAALRVGGLVELNLPRGEAFQGAVVPTAAVIDDDGRPIVYVQRDGEHFEARATRLGPRVGNRQAVLEGLREGERIVTRGAYLVRLADRPKGQTSHGHLH